VHYSPALFGAIKSGGGQTEVSGTLAKKICSPPLVMPAQSVLAVVSKVPQEGGTIAIIAVYIKSAFSMLSWEICKKIGTVLDDENVSARLLNIRRKYAIDQSCLIQRHVS
jgi:hypothetical protein